MNRIDETANKMKKKLSFNDYEKPTSIQEAAPATLPKESSENEQKSKITFYLNSDIEDKINDMIISRMKERLKVNRSMIICKAIELMHAIEEKEGILSL